MPCHARGADIGGVQGHDKQEMEEIKMQKGWRIHDYRIPSQPDRSGSMHAYSMGMIFFSGDTTYTPLHYQKEAFRVVYFFDTTCFRKSLKPFSFYFIPLTAFMKVAIRPCVHISLIICFVRLCYF